MKQLLFCLGLWLIGNSTTFAQTITLSGTVTDDGGEPVVGVTVLIKGTNKGVLTDTYGRFSIQLDSGTYQIVISYTGFNTQEIKKHVAAGGQNVLNVQLGASAAALQECVVVGYGSKKADQKLKGRVAGVVAKRQADKMAQKPQPTPKTPSPYVSAGKKEEKERRKRHLHNRADSVAPEFNTENYDRIAENPFLSAVQNPLSTFSIDVDAASYANLRRFLNDGQLPPTDAVRIEEMINYFDYNYPQRAGKHPFTINSELGICPWKPEHRLLMVNLRGMDIDAAQLPPSNLVFLIDVSGSMDSEDKLPLVQESLRLLTDRLRPADRVAIVVYAGAAGLVLPSTSGADKAAIKAAVDRLNAGGSTAGAAGIQLAYKTALENFLPGGNNRVILCTDGDFNVGTSSDGDLVRLIEEKRKSGVYLTVLGFGTGNYQDAKMQQLADKGNGNHAYIDSRAEAQKVLVKEFGGTLFTIAKDVKFQLEFNPAKVAAYRLIGYENRLLDKEDFNDDTKDAGELGAGHRVTALYEIVPAGQPVPETIGSVDRLKYQKTTIDPAASRSKDLLTLKLRYKQPHGDQKSLLIEQTVQDIATADNTPDFQLASTVAAFGLLLRDSAYKGSATYAQMLRSAQALSKNDPNGYRTELAGLIQKAMGIATAATAEKK